MKKISSKLFLQISSGFIASALTSYLIFTYPRTFNRTYEGIQFRTGSKEQALVEKVTIQFKGKLSHNALLGHKFKGTIQINDTILPQHIDELDLKFQPWLDYQAVTLCYEYYDKSSNSIKSPFYGWLTIDDAFNNIMIHVAEPNNTGGHQWHGDNGLTIAAPATTREEALAICNHFLEKTPSSPLE